MNPSGSISPFAQWRVLSAEAIADAVRRRIVPVVIVFALLSLLGIDSCSSCAPSAVQNGKPVEIDALRGGFALLATLCLTLWTLVLAGVLASDHLAETLSDGSAALVLARPVSRGVFASSRLSGVLALSYACGLVLLGSSVWLFSTRQGLPLAPLPALWLACASGALTVASLAMAASLWLPRALIALLVFGGIGVVAAVDLAAIGGAKLGGAVGILANYGPGFAAAPTLALSAWAGAFGENLEPLSIALRSLLWAIGSYGLLVASLRRIEIS